MNHILNWKLFESGQENWPSDWVNLPEWKVLEEMGFTSNENRIGSILVDHPVLPRTYLALTRNGYIRRPGVNGYLEYNRERNLSQMFRSVAIRNKKSFEKYSKEKGQTQKDIEILRKIQEYEKDVMAIPDPTPELTSNQIIILNSHVDGKWKVNEEGLVEIEGDLRSNPKKAKFPKIVNKEEELEKIKFGNISGSVAIESEIGKLTKFLGIVNKDFSISKIKLTSLEGSPKEVRGNFSCYNNQLTSLKGAPIHVGGDFSCSGNQLTSLKGAPEKIGGMFLCDEFIIGRGEWGSKAFLQLIIQGSKLAVSLLTDPTDQSQITDQANLELKKKGNFNQWEFIFELPWYKPTPFVEALYRTWKKGL
jgi:hypothetical protein